MRYTNAHWAELADMASALGRCSSLPTPEVRRYTNLHF